MHFGVQGFDTAVKHFREPGVFRHLSDGQSSVGQQLGRAAGGEQLDIERVQGAGKFEYAGFVGNGN